MNKRTTLIVFGVLSLLTGIASIQTDYLFTEQNNDHCYFFILCFAVIFLGINLLVKVTKFKNNCIPKTKQ